MSVNTTIEKFMNAFPHTGMTFDDVSLETQYSDFLPDEAQTTTRLTRNLTMNVPFISAAMDTVTESSMAISMAMMGGIGVIHKNMSSDEQAAMVREVKHYLNGLISEPITFQSNETVETVQQKRMQRGYNFSGFPIVNEDGLLVGILTSRDLKFCNHLRAPISDIMTHELVTAPSGTTLEQAYEIMRKHRIGKLPLVDPHNKLTGLYSYTDVSALVENMNPTYNRDENHCLRIAAAIGPGNEERVEKLVANDVDILVVDTAHGHSKGVMDITRWIKKQYAHVEVIAGNIATAEAALALRDAGADAVKVGIGPGSICTTRVVAGVGVPQITAIYDCSQALDNTIPVISDGGIRHSGDVVKAIVAGADSVMMGSVFAGTDESPGEKIIYEGRQYVVYRGMGSIDAMKAREGSRERYGQKDADQDELVPQGIEGMVPFAGSVEKVMKQYIGGLKAGMGYCGCRSITALREKGTFIKITGAGVREAHPHDIRITKEAPNYRS